MESSSKSALRDTERETEITINESLPVALSLPQPIRTHRHRVIVLQLDDVSDPNVPPLLTLEPGR